MAYNYISEIADKLGATEGYSDIEKIANAVGGGSGGSGGGVFVVEYTRNSGYPQVTTSSKTWREILDASHAGLVPIAKNAYSETYINFYLITNISENSGEYLITIGSPDGIYLTCTDPDDYPTYTYTPE